MKIISIQIGIAFTGHSSQGCLLEHLKDFDGMRHFLTTENPLR